MHRGFDLTSLFLHFVPQVTSYLIGILHRLFLSVLLRITIDTITLQGTLLAYSSVHQEGIPLSVLLRVTMDTLAPR